VTADRGATPLPALDFKYGTSLAIGERP
jgi:hypothetical protein